MFFNSTAYLNCLHISVFEMCSFLRACTKAFWSSDLTSSSVETQYSPRACAGVFLCLLWCSILTIYVSVLLSALNLLHKSSEDNPHFRRSYLTVSSSSRWHGLVLTLQIAFSSAPQPDSSRPCRFSCTWKIHPSINVCDNISRRGPRDVGACFATSSRGTMFRYVSCWLLIKSV